MQDSKNLQPQSESVSNANNKTVQNKAITLEDNRPSTILQKKANNTGLPDNLKSGIENLSGHSMDDVKVHYNSDKPAQLNAHAYAQGTDIHIASGQEKHLPHEAWHVVQQKQGRVKPTMQMKGKVNVNDDKGLEKEADVMGAKALQMKDTVEVIKNKSSEQNRMQVTQGYFMNGMVKGTEEDMEEKFQKVKSEVKYLSKFESEFDTLNKDENDNGQLFDFLVNTAQEKQKKWVAAISHNAGLNSSQFSEALNDVSKSVGKPKKESLRLDLEKIKQDEFEEEQKGGTPVSPRNRSRLIQIPNLVAMVTKLFAQNELLKNFNFILGGGSALTLKYPKDGRLGRSSENMRDIDMDFQINKKQSPTEIFKKESQKGLKSLINEVKIAMVNELAKLSGEDGALFTGEPSITMGTTIIFKSWDLEYSFHFIDGISEKELGVDEMNSPDAGPFLVINDDSHWSMTTSALENRLSRPDKIHKTLIDALVLAGKSKNRVDQIGVIIKDNALHIGNIKRILKGLYLDRKDSSKAGKISGLEPKTAKTASDHLDKIKSSFMDNKKLSNNEIISARFKYLGTVAAILKDISTKADSANRNQVKLNAEKVISDMNNFKKWIKGYEHYVNIPRE
ncbi:conserved hypothetical protein [Flavobacterium sp. 9AF]|uniref:eCIS core domain-containing protein n=1 Tax=Flavobacterium sp. 9AF TaxID=2653142 RepID=UPI0012F1C7BF|nr:DUF4157 domain-containing protein [Flavobacterium sp. 9AF]VXB09218.1 conserved hypothetical protein [Flavobacterium sp. 9AF]